MKSILVVAIMFIGSLTFAQPGGGQGGQQGPPPIPSDEQIEQLVSDLASELSLSTDQETTILELNKAHFTEVKAKMSSNSRPKREEMEALDAALEKNVKAELTEEQITKYEAFMKKQKSQRPKK